MTRDVSNNDLGRMLTPIEVAELLAVSQAALARWRRTGSGPRFVKLTRGRSGLIRYRQADLDAFIESSVRKSTSDNGE